MSAEKFVQLIEEMVDIKVQQHSEFHLQGKPELARLLEQKRATDRRRLDMIKQELVNLLSSPVG